MTAERLQLQLHLGDGAVVLPAPPDLLAAVESASVQSNPGGRTGFQLSLRAPSRDVAAALLARLPPSREARLVIALLVDGAATVVSDGILTQHQVAIASNGSVAIGLTGEDLTFLMDLDDRTGTVLQGSANQQVRACLTPLRRLGITAAVDDKVQASTQADHPAEAMPTQQGTDYAHVTRLAADLGFVFHLAPDDVGRSTAHWGPPVVDTTQLPPLTLGMGHRSNLESLAFTLVPHQGTARYTLAADGTRTDVAPAVGLAPRLARQPLPPQRRAPVREAAARSPGLVDPTYTARQALDAAAVTGQGTLDVARYGGLLRPHRVVPVRGATAPYDGLYLVTSVSTQISRTGVTQSFALQREGLYPL